MNTSPSPEYTLGVLPLIVIIAPAYAQDAIEEAEAERIARLFYSLTGRSAPEAFLQDDVLALQESGRSAQELERVVRWIAGNVPGADRSTLAAILETHTAAALGEQEEVVQVDLGPAEVLEQSDQAQVLWTPTVAQLQDLLRIYYEGTDRPVPDPPLPADLQGFRDLSAEGWTEAGVNTLVRWVPANVEGADKLSFGQAAGVALQDNAYVGGPRWDGSLENPPEMVAPLWQVKEPLFSQRQPTRYDGGRLRTVGTMGALPSALDQGVRGAMLPGQDLQIAELGGSVGQRTLGDGWVSMGQATPQSGWSVELSLGNHAPGSLERDGVSWDGGTPRTLGQPLTQPTFGGRASFGRGSKLAWGGSGWGYQGAEQAAVGGALSLRLRNPELTVLMELGASGGQLPVAGVPVGRQRIHLELAPTLSLGAQSALVLRYRFFGGSGTLASPAPGDQGDLYTEHLHQLSARLEAGPPSLRYGLLLGYESGAWALDWERALEQGGLDTFHYDGPFRELELAAGINKGWGANNWVSAGLRVAGGPDQDLTLESSLALRTLFRDRLWLGAGGRLSTQESSLMLSLAVPL